MTLTVLPVLSEAAGYLASSGSPEGFGQSEDRDIWHGVDQYFLIPILESEDMASTFRQMRNAYGEWRDSVAYDSVSDEGIGEKFDQNLEALLDAEDQLIDLWRTGFQTAAGILEPEDVKAILGALDLRQIVSHSTWPYIRSWPEESWEYIEQRMVSHELCMLSVTHHVGTGIGQKSNIRKLVVWSFKFVEEAYYEAGRNGRSAGPLERTG
jgi:hypothetical protein